MNPQLDTWRFIIKSIKKNIPVMLLYVLESKGSSPGRQGFFMAVNAKKKMSGSIGGGIMEHKFVEKAFEEITNNKLKITNLPAGPKDSGLLRSKQGNKGEVRKQLHDKAVGKNQSGMICSGEQTILIYAVQEKDVRHIKKLVKSLEKNKNWTLHLLPEGILFNKRAPEKNFEFSFENDNEWTYTEKTGYKNHLYIIGGGHCALALSRIMSRMDFYIHLFETREGLNTMKANEFAHKKKIVGSYSDLGKIIPSGKNNYVVIMTFGYRTDDIVLKALLGKRFKYLGLLGSKKKIEKMYNDFRTEGIDDETLNKIYSPIGINIKSETPEEIAISIAGEMIAVKNKS
jgi:xanthine dehydrogenase accessory factor